MALGLTESASGFLVNVLWVFDYFDSFSADAGAVFVDVSDSYLVSSLPIAEHWCPSLLHLICSKILVVL